MKKSAWLLVCLSVLTLGSLLAQASDGSNPYRADVPFAFNIQNQTYAPGVYTMYEKNGVLHVRNEKDKSEKAYLVIREDRASKDAKSGMRFTEIDGKKYLTAIWGTSLQSGLEVVQNAKTAEQLMAAGSR